MLQETVVSKTVTDRLNEQSEQHEAAVRWLALSWSHHCPLKKTCMWFLRKSLKLTELSHEMQKSSRPCFDYLEKEEFLIASQWWRNLSLFLPVHTLGINSWVCITPLIRLTAAEVIALWFLYGSVCACVCKPHDQRFEQNVVPHLRTANSVKCDILLWNWKEHIVLTCFYYL